MRAGGYRENESMRSQHPIPIRSSDDAEDEAEACRLDALDRLDLMDTPREEPFDRVARLVRNIFGVRFAVVSGIDAHRQWLKAAEGPSAKEWARSDSFCRYIIAEPKPLIVKDARKDDRFADNIHVIGPPHVRFYAGVPLVTRDGYTIGTVCAFDDGVRDFGLRDVEILTDLASVVMDALEARQAVAVDVLTGVASRRAFFDQGQGLVERCRQRTEPLACVVLDIDHFKAVNDTFGHATGDAVLAGVAHACRQGLRRRDLLGRLGGEELAFLLPGTDSRSALAIAERVRQAIEATPFSAAGTTISVTASFGVAMSKADEDLYSLLAEADAALYRAKGAGRNRVVAQPDETKPKPARRRVLKAGRIVPVGAPSQDCTVRALGEDGADLMVSAPHGVPSRFVLLIPSEGTQRSCRVEGRDDRQIAVAFV